MCLEALKPSDLPKLIEVLRQVQKEDPTIKIEINEETGEHLMHGMGELHLEIIENRIKSEKGVDVKTSPPAFVILNTLALLGIITVFNVNVKSNPPKLCGFAVLYHPLFKLDPKLSAIGVK